MTDSNDTADALVTWEPSVQRDEYPQHEVFFAGDLVGCHSRVNYRASSGEKVDYQLFSPSSLAQLAGISRKRAREFVADNPTREVLNDRIQEAMLEWLKSGSPGPSEGEGKEPTP